MLTGHPQKIPRHSDLESRKASSLSKTTSKRPWLLALSLHKTQMANLICGIGPLCEWHVAKVTDRNRNCITPPRVARVSNRLAFHQPHFPPSNHAPSQVLTKLNQGNRMGSRKTSRHRLDNLHHVRRAQHPAATLTRPQPSRMEHKTHGQRACGRSARSGIDKLRVGQLGRNRHELRVEHPVVRPAD